MSEQRRLCEVKDRLIQIHKQLIRGRYAGDGRGPWPRFRFAVDELRCPSRSGHCDDPSKPCRAWEERNNRVVLDRIEQELFTIGFTREDETFGKEQQR